MEDVCQGPHQMEDNSAKGKGSQLSVELTELKLPRFGMNKSHFVTTCWIRLNPFFCDPTKSCKILKIAHKLWLLQRPI